MKIIKPGNKPGNGKSLYRQWLFKCEVCGCEFTATLSECIPDYDMLKPTAYACKCPECQHFAFYGKELVSKRRRWPENSADGKN